MRGYFFAINAEERQFESVHPIASSFPAKSLHTCVYFCFFNPAVDDCFFSLVHKVEHGNKVLKILICASVYFLYTSLWSSDTLL